MANRRAPRQKTAKRTRPESGARLQHTGAADRWRSYLAHHRSSAMESLRRLLSAPLQSLMTWLVIAVALALPATFLVAVDNLRMAADNWDGIPRINVFIRTQTSPQVVAELRKRFGEDQRIHSVEWVSPQQALEEFESSTGLGRALRLLDENPLPASFVITPAGNLAPPQQIRLGEWLRKLEEVDEVVYDRAWIERLHRLLQLGSQVAWSLGLLLALGVWLVIGNTIRLAIDNRRDEIVVIKLVGGSSAFARRPFLYTGIWYGLIGGLLGLLILVGLLVWLSDPVAALAQSYQSSLRLQFPGIGMSAALIAISSLLGWFGAWLAVGRHLGEIEPR